MSLSIRLRWVDTNIAETGHKIYRSQATMDVDALPTELATLGADVTEYLDESVEEGETYYYRVSAFSGSGERVSAEIQVLAQSQLGAGLILPKIITLPTSSGEFEQFGATGVRGLHLSPDGTKAILMGLGGRGIASLTLTTPGSLVGAVRTHFWSADQAVLAARIFGEGNQKALVALNNPWRIKHLSLRNEWSFLGGPTLIEEVTSLNGKTGGSFLVSSDGLWGVHYAYDAANVSFFTLPTPGAIGAASIQYEVDLSTVLAFSSSESLAGVNVSDDGKSVWVFVGSFSGNTAGRIVQFRLTTPYDLRTRLGATTVPIPGGLFTAAHPVGWYGPGNKLLLCHQASQFIREYTAATLSW